MQNPEYLRPTHPDQPVILIAEDEVMIRNIARVTLEREGYFVLAAENGEAALLLSRQYPGRIHLLLTNVEMPKMSGLELINQISTERPGVLIVLMSGSFAENINPKFPFLQKPFPFKELTETIRGLIPVRHDTQT